MQDLYGDWLRQREVDENGVILVRPDKHIGWRTQSMVADPETALFDALSALLHVKQATIAVSDDARRHEELAFA